MKKVAGRIKGELAQYREMAAFAQFGSDLDATTQRMLNRGSRLTELLKQPQFSPLKMEEQVCVIYAGVNGYLDPLPVPRVRAFEHGLLTTLRSQHAGILDAIRTTRDLDDQTATKLKSAVDGYAKSFARCRWSRPPSCAARRRPRKPRAPMRSIWTRCWATSPAASRGSKRHHGFSPAPAASRSTCSWYARPSAAFAGLSTRRSCGLHAS